MQAYVNRLSFVDNLFLVCILSIIARLRTVRGGMMILSAYFSMKKSA